jgi:hypothetical protein
MVFSLTGTKNLESWKFRYYQTGRPLEHAWKCKAGRTGVETEQRSLLSYRRLAAHSGVKARKGYRATASQTPEAIFSTNAPSLYPKTHASGKHEKQG